MMVDFTMTDLADDIRRGVSALEFSIFRFQDQTSLDIKVHEEAEEELTRIQLEAAYSAVEQHKVFCNAATIGEHQRPPVGPDTPAVSCCRRLEAALTNHASKSEIATLANEYRSALADDLISRVQARGREVLDALSSPWLFPEGEDPEGGMSHKEEQEWIARILAERTAH